MTPLNAKFDPNLYYGFTETLHEAKSQLNGALEQLEYYIKESGQIKTAEAMGIPAQAMPLLLDSIKTAAERLNTVNDYIEKNQEPEYPPEPTAAEMEEEDRKMQEAIDSDIADREIQNEILESMNPEPGTEYEENRDYAQDNDIEINDPEAALADYESQEYYDDGN